MLALVDEGRVARDDEEPAQLRQRGDDVLADAVGEIILLRLAAHVGEGQHGDRGPVGQRQCRRRAAPASLRRCGGARRRRSVTAPTKRNALARDGADQPLLFAAVVERAPRRVDAAGQRRFRDDAAVPDRVEQIVPRHHALAVADQIDERSNTCGSTRDERLRPPQFAARRDRARNPRTEMPRSAPKLGSRQPVAQNQGVSQA